MVKLMIADDHVMVREGIKQLLELKGTMEVVSQASNGRECITKYMEQNPDVLLLDINMPEMNGLDTLREIKKKRPKSRIIMLSVHNEAEYLVDCIDAKADGYVLKDSGSQELEAAIEAVYRGETYIQPQLLPLLNSALISRDNDKEKLDSLTRREMEILKLVAQGKFNRQIAEELDISERTVKNHMSNIFSKLEICDRTQAAIFAVKNNIVRPY